MTESLERDRRATTALEFAICFPVFLLFVFGSFAGYGLVTAKRAMDYGVEKALRYAAVHGGGGTAPVIAAYNTAAGVIWKQAGISSTVTVTPATYAAGQTVTVNVTYAWSAPAGLKAPTTSTIFNPVTLSAGGSMQVVH